MQVGAVSLLLVETAVAGGPRIGIAAGMGVATVDLLFAAAAAVRGGNCGSRRWREHETELRLVAAVVLAAIALHGLATSGEKAATSGSRRRQAAPSPTTSVSSRSRRQIR